VDELARAVRADFDRLAAFAADDWNHNHVYHDRLLEAVPVPCRAALDLGCGAGDFTRRLAERSASVIGLDFSEAMIDAARQRTEAPHVRYEVADITTYALPAEAFDCIASLTTLHHVDLPTLLARLVAALRPGGRLLILDIPRETGLADLAYAAHGAPLTRSLLFRATGSLRRDPAAVKAWIEHGERDTYTSMAELRALARERLPGARIRRHVLWRYSLVWTKPH